MKRRRLKKKTVFAALITALSLTGIIYSIINIFSWKKDTKENNKIKEEVNENIKINEQTREYVVDFEKLKEQNNDTVAYLRIKNTTIEYPVVKTTDNEYYLRHNFNKEYNIAGWIFADYRNKFDGTDFNIIIYGHNMKDGSMFSDLKKILNNNYEDNIITLITQSETIEYKIFSTYIIEPEDYYIQTEFNTISYNDFLNIIKDRTTYNYNETINEHDKILTLSTCNENGNKRIVVHAKKINRD